MAQYNVSWDEAIDDSEVPLLQPAKSSYRPLFGRKVKARRKAGNWKGALKAATGASVLPWVIFSTLVMLYPMCYHMHPCWVQCIVPTAFFICLWESMVSHKGHHDISYTLLVCSFALFAGASIGYCEYHHTVWRFFVYPEGQHYTNVWPDELAAAHRDASAIVFAPGAAPDVAKAVSFTNSYHTFCVAPITMPNPDAAATNVQYWAVGKDCCINGPIADFTCGDTGKAEAHSGLVIVNRTHGMFDLWETKPVDAYAKAVIMAQHQFGLAAVEEPIFVDWTKDLDDARWQFFYRTLAMQILAIGVGLPVFILLGMQTPEALAFAQHVTFGPAADQEGRPGSGNSRV